MTKIEISLSETEALQQPKTLFAALGEKNVVLEAGCNGSGRCGRCGRCRVRYLSAAPLPTATERRFFSAQELREGMRLACLHPVSRACSVEPMYVQPAGVQIVTENLELAQIFEAGAQKGWCIAVDLGTTTIAMQARSLADGSVLGVWKSMNPQRRFGSDVISRMQAANEGAAQELKSSVEAVLAAGIRKMIETVQENQSGQESRSGQESQSGQESRSAQESQSAQGALRGIYVAGNTVMEHLLAGLSVERLCRHPFCPVTLEEQRLCIPLEGGGGAEQSIQDLAERGRGTERGSLPESASAQGSLPEGAVVQKSLPENASVQESLPESASVQESLPESASAQELPCIVEKSAFVTLLPGFSAFVGADLLAGVLACGMHRKKEISLLIDLGTNGEIVLGNSERLLCTATAAGPAFEGGPGNPVPGTDMIAVIAELMDAGIVDETGLMEEPWFETGIDWTPTGAVQTVRMTQEQIRAIQMAKAAVHAGICIIAKEYRIALSDISQVYLAGGFGYYLNVEKAARIGLFPDELKGKVQAVGNTSLSGAYLYGRNAAREEAVRIKGTCRAINLAEHPDFESIYLEHLDLK